MCVWYKKYVTDGRVESIHRKHCSIPKKCDESREPILLLINFLNYRKYAAKDLASKYSSK
jgi:hypothetical protein